MSKIFIFKDFARQACHFLEEETQILQNLSQIQVHQTMEIILVSILVEKRKIEEACLVYSINYFGFGFNKFLVL